VQTIAEPEAIPGKPGAIERQPGDLNVNTPEGVAHGEPDSMPGEDINPNPNAPVHLEGTGPEVMLEEGGIAGEDASIEGDRDPLVELQEPGVSHLAMLEEDKFLILSPPPPITPEAASMQRSPAVNTRMSATPVQDHGADLEPQPHDTPTPNEAAFTCRLSRSKPPLKLEGHWSRSRARNHSARWARGA